MNQIKGVLSVLKTWDMDKVIYNINHRLVLTSYQALDKEEVLSKVQEWLNEKNIPLNVTT